MIITVKQHEKLIDKISGLCEIELDQLLSDIADHLRKNNLNHLADNAFQFDDFEGEIEELQDKISELETKLEDAETDKGVIQGKIDDALELIEDLEGEEFGEDYGREQIEKIKQSLQ